MMSKACESRGGQEALQTKDCMARTSHMCLAMKQQPRDKHCCLLLHLMNAMQQTFSATTWIWRMPTHGHMA